MALADPKTPDGDVPVSEIGAESARIPARRAYDRIVVQSCSASVDQELRDTEVSCAALSSGPVDTDLADISHADMLTEMPRSSTAEAGASFDHEVDPGTVRDAILDAAEESVIEYGYGTRLHAVIAKRAGVSRPTVYKYVGNQSAIVEALFQRELATFFARLDEAIVFDREHPECRFVDFIVFAVQFARSHRLLQKGLRDHPEITLPWFAAHAKSIVTVADDLLTVQNERKRAPRGVPGSHPIAVTEWIFRVAASLIVTECVVDTDDEESLRDFVTALTTIAPESAGVLRDLDVGGPQASNRFRQA